jgi:hypothetical protein
MRRKFASGKLSGGFLWKGEWNFEHHESWEIYVPADGLSARQGG